MLNATVHAKYQQKNFTVKFIASTGP